LTEEEIIKGCIQNNAHCQHALFKQYAGRVMGICLRYASGTSEAQDMLQHTFIKLFDSIHQFRFQGSFEGWIKKIAVRTCLAALQKKHIQYVDINAADFIADTSALHAISALSEKELMEMIRRLPEGYRIVFNLYVIEGYNHDEISAMLNIESVTSRSQLAKARRMLQKQILLEQNNITRHVG
jgi:RNA polymerase sigma factor (sigma-70 family)